MDYTQVVFLNDLLHFLKEIGIFDRIKILTHTYYTYIIIFVRRVTNDTERDNKINEGQ